MKSVYRVVTRDTLTFLRSWKISLRDSLVNDVAQSLVKESHVILMLLKYMNNQESRVQVLIRLCFAYSTSEVKLSLLSRSITGKEEDTTKTAQKKKKPKKIARWFVFESLVKKVQIDLDLEKMKNLIQSFSQEKGYVLENDFVALFENMKKLKMKKSKSKKKLLFECRESYVHKKEIERSKYVTTFVSPYIKEATLRIYARSSNIDSKFVSKLIRNCIVEVEEEDFQSRIHKCIESVTKSCLDVSLKDGKDTVHEKCCANDTTTFKSIFRPIFTGKKYDLMYAMGRVNDTSTHRNFLFLPVEEKAIKESESSSSSSPVSMSQNSCRLSLTHLLT